MGLTASLVSTLLGLFPRSARTGSQGTDALQQQNLHRLARYRENWAAYHGMALEMISNEDGTRSTRVNFLKRNIDKVNYFSFGLGYKATHIRYQDALNLADITWGIKKIEKLLRMGQYGSVTGDAFIMVAPKVIDDSPAPMDEKEDTEEGNAVSAKVRVVILPSEYVTPFYDPFDMDVLEKVQIRVPFQREVKGENVTFYQYMEITPKTVKSGILDGEFQVYGASIDTPNTDLKTEVNPIGHVYVRHVRNYPSGDSIYGVDDVNEVRVLNEAYTERLTDIGNIIAYHSAPTTLVFGARVQGLTRGANKIWGNLPKDGEVKNLELKTDLKAANDHLAKIKEDLHVCSGVPEIAQGTHQAISNTSGIALHTMYLPLIERADVKQGIYGPELIEVSILALRWLKALNMATMLNEETNREITVDLPETDRQWEDLRINTKMTWPSPLPKDELIETQVQSARLTAGIQSKRGALVALGDPNPEATLEEIEEDAAEAQERQIELTTAQADATAKAKAANAPGDVSKASGDKPLDTDRTSVESGASADQGSNSTDTSSQRGRPKE